jgi:hypothetical protein
MTPPSPRLSSLKTFFWTILACNGAEFLAFIFFLVRTSNMSLSIDQKYAGVLYLMLFLLALPYLQIYLAMFLLNNYFPAREFNSWLRVFILSLCVIQILSSVFLAVISTNAVFVELPKVRSRTHNDSFILPAFGMAISMAVASLCNLIAAVVLWRTMGVIRRKFRTGAWESFETTVQNE